MRDIHQAKMMFRVLALQNYVEPLEYIDTEDKTMLVRDAIEGGPVARISRKNVFRTYDAARNALIRINAERVKNATAELTKARQALHDSAIAASVLGTDVPQRTTEWMETISGVSYYPGEPDPREVVLDDIAHALGMLCRFGGHVERFYSVAEHCVHVSRLVPPKYAMQGLMHDATEAYLVDVPRPLKYQLIGYKEIEHANWLAICEKLDLDPYLHPCVHRADNAMLLCEKSELKPSVRNWAINETPAEVELFCWPPAEAKRQFLARYEEILANPVVDEEESDAF